MWLNEGGQSATGKLIDHIITTHPAYPTLKQSLDSADSDIYTLLASHAKKLALSDGIPLHKLTKDLHILPDFHGNRSPLADPDMKGMISGLTLSSNIDNLAVLYIATLQSLALGTRHIVDVLCQNGHVVNLVNMCGGLTKNLLFVQMMADCLNRNVVVPNEKESVLLGAALCGRCADKESSLIDIINSVNCDGTVFYPDINVVDYYNKKYQIYLNMVEQQKSYRQIMEESC